MKDLEGKLGDEEKGEIEYFRYLGHKSCFLHHYKTIQTNIVFAENEIELYQGSGYFKAKELQKTTIKYSDIQSVEVTRKIGISSIVCICLLILLFFIVQKWSVTFIFLLGVFLTLYGDSYIVTKINYQNGMTYDIVTDNKTEGLEVKQIIDTALMQYNNG